MSQGMRRAPALGGLLAVDDRRELDSVVVGREACAARGTGVGWAPPGLASLSRDPITGEQVVVVVESVVVGESAVVEVRLLRNHRDDGVADGERLLDVAHVQHREPEVRGCEDAVLVPHTERLLHDARGRGRIVPVAEDVRVGLADEVVAAEAHARGDSPLVQVCARRDDSVSARVRPPCCEPRTGQRPARVHA